jgi:Short C-terminal domain
MMRRRPIARMAVRTTAVVGTAAVVGGHMANKQAQAAQEQAQAAPPEYAPAPAPAPAPAAPAADPIAQLTQLAALRDSGALTEAEFEAQKAKVLG